MIDSILRISIALRWLVMFFVLVVAVASIWNYQRLPSDTVRDSTNDKVQINSATPEY